ncbi:MAG TPA: lytic transglycosylase domain-containing protein [Ktedonobacteraceae bacterium]|jgi:soluble lytic murein transglycosylase-like protein
MQKNLNIQPNGLADVRPSELTKRSRIGLAFAGTGCACALLVGGLFSAHTAASSSQSQANAAKISAPIVRVVADKHVATKSFLMKTATMSYESSSSANNTYWNIAWNAAVNAGIDPNLFERQINQESGYNPSAVSPAGAEGIAQFMPATASSMGVNPWDPTSALNGAASLMAQLSNQFGGNYAQALAAYNAGPGAVQYAINAGGSNWYAYLPAETQNYVTTIMG